MKSNIFEILYYKNNDPEFVFDSDLIRNVSVDRSYQFNDAAIAVFLADPSTPMWPRTFFAGVSAILAGTQAPSPGNGPAVLTSHWNPPTEPVDRFPKPEHYVEAARELVEKAVARAISGAKRVGAHVSGGIDSTGIGVIAAKQLRERGDHLAGAYTWSPAVSEQHPLVGARDERDRVRLAADDAPIRYGRADEHNFLAFLERPLEYEGVADLADEIPMLELAAQDGIDVMLSGWGGDEAFSAHGFGYMAYLLTTGQFGRSARFARSQLRTLRKLGPLASLLWSQGIYPLLPTPLYNRLSPYRHHYPTMCFMSEDLKRTYRDEIAERRQPLKFGPNIGENIKNHLLYGHIGMRIETWANWARPHGFEYRYPLLDRELLEFVMTIPPEILFMNDQPRGLALETFKDILPPNVTKHDYANERLRETTRYKAWVLIADKVKRGEWLAQDDCPWFDMKAFRASALTPKPQNIAENIMEFAELFTALRVWHMYRRHYPAG